MQITKVNQFNGHKGSVYAMTTDTAEKTLYTSGDDGMVAAWDLQITDDTGTGVLRLSESVYSLCYIPENDLLLAGSSIGNLYVVDLQKQQLVFQWRLNREALYEMYYDADLREVWMLHGKGHLSILSLPEMEVKTTIQPAQNHLRCICPGLGGEFLWIGSSNHEIIQMSKSGPHAIHSWKAHANSVFSLALHPEGKYLLSGGRDAHLKVWDLQQNLAEIKSIPAHHFTINAISISPKGDYFVTASRDKTLKIWDAWSFELLKVVDQPRNDAHIHSVNRIRWLQDGTIVSCSDDRTAMRWKVED